MSLLAVVLAQLSGKGKDLPPQTGDFSVSPTGFVIVFGIGFGVAVLGHIFRSRTMVAVGIALVFVSTIVIPVYLQIVH
jgi:hypothetical protein